MDASSIGNEVTVINEATGETRRGEIESVEDGGWITVLFDDGSTERLQKLPN